MVNGGYLLLNNLKHIYPLGLCLTKDHPEQTHNLLLDSLEKLSNNPNKDFKQLILKELESTFCFSDNSLEQTLLGLKFNNPIGLAPGLDKNAQAISVWPYFGFGFSELGAITYKSQEGNPTPRLLRVPEDSAILNHMGANNIGAYWVSKRLECAFNNKTSSIPIGINICKSKVTPNEEAPEDYLNSLSKVYPYIDYITINISSPNTPLLRSLHDEELLSNVLRTLQSFNNSKKPIFVKVSPDLNWEQLSSVIDTCRQHQISGIVATNTTLDRNNLKTKGLPEVGGISGKPLRERSTEIISFIYKETKGNMLIIGVGGIDDVESAWEKIISGASLLQVYTGWVFKGPWVIKDILQGLTKKLKQHNLANIEQAIGLKFK
jgi:dihydroorotate dehydrogenase